MNFPEKSPKEMPLTCKGGTNGGYFVNIGCGHGFELRFRSRFSKRTHTSHGETLVTSPIAPAGILAGGSSSHLSLTRCPITKFPFLIALQPVDILSCIRHRPL